LGGAQPLALLAQSLRSSQKLSLSSNHALVGKVKSTLLRSRYVGFKGGSGVNGFNAASQSIEAGLSLSNNWQEAE
jgi:hypothetical protein